MEHSITVRTKPGNTNRFFNNLRRIRVLYSDNGFIWTSYFLLYSLSAGIGSSLQRSMREREVQHSLPGMNTIARNYEQWQNRNWEDGGEDWTYSVEWKQSLIDEVMLHYIEPERNILEIGPGSGRWTETLQKIASHLTLVDLSDHCIELCRNKFGQFENLEFFVNDGASLSMVANETIDFIWSFDVFVHINPEDTEKYLLEFVRVLRRGGRGIIHHPREGGLYGGWRSSMTAKLFAALLKKNGLTLITQFDSWGEDKQFNLNLHNDMITVFQR